VFFLFNQLLSSAEGLIYKRGSEGFIYKECAAEGQKESGCMT
jgi:hypothetical protein